MANIDAPYGLRPIKNLNGSPWSGGTVKCSILAADSTATFIGDMVKLSGTASAEGYPSVAQFTAADICFGVVTSFDPDPDDPSVQYRKASTLRNCNVVPADDALFAINSDGATVITDLGQTADIVASPTGSTSTGVSGMELDDSDIGTGANLHILGFVEAPDNEIGAAGVDVIVRINESTLHSAATAT